MLPPIVLYMAVFRLYCPVLYCIVAPSATLAAVAATIALRGPNCAPDTCIARGTRNLYNGMVCFDMDCNAIVSSYSTVLV